MLDHQPIGKMTDKEKKVIEVLRLPVRKATTVLRDGVERDYLIEIEK
jgi:hypothetical protein